MQFRGVFLVASIVLVTALAGCAQKNTNTTTSPTSGDATVSMKNLAFKPDAVTIKAGQKVTWTNDDALNHDVTPKGNTTSWNPGGKGAIPPGATFEKTFMEAGVFEYYCQEHGMTMDGSVTVTA